MADLLLDAGAMFLLDGEGKLIPRDMAKENSPEVKELREKLKAAGNMEHSKGLRAE